jgi:hypothetical protein
MPRTDLLEQSATRVELEQRAREARLRLECVERLLAVRRLPRQSLLRRVLRCLRLRSYAGGQIEGRSDAPTLRGGSARRDREMADETGGTVGNGFAAPPVSWPSCAGAIRMSPVRVPTVRHGLRRWNCWCGPGGWNSRFLWDNRF